MKELFLCAFELTFMSFYVCCVCISIRSAELQATALATMQTASSAIAAKHEQLVHAQRELEASREATKHELAVAAEEVSALNSRVATLQSEVEAGAMLRTCRSPPFMNTLMLLF